MHCIMANPSKEGRDFSHVYTNCGVNSDDRGAHTRKTNLQTNFKGKGGGGEAPKALPPHPSDLTLP